MSTPNFVKQHSGNIMRVLAALALSALTAALIFAFGSGVLPHSGDGDAFDTIYAIEETE